MLSRRETPSVPKMASYPLMWCTRALWVSPYGPWSQVVHYIGNRVLFWDETNHQRDSRQAGMSDEIYNAVDCDIMERTEQIGSYLPGREQNR